jgi:glyceraldehyde-3-phosphate dehydrogenase/erythrose-4-phosphate dehydrogenase
VIGLARSYGAAVEVEMLGAVVAEADALDSGALSRVVKDASPDAVVHLLTAIPAKINLRRISRDFAQTRRGQRRVPARGHNRTLSRHSRHLGGPVGSADIVGDSRAAIVDLDLTKVVDGTLVKVMAWYDNEWGFTHQMIRQARSILSPVA